MYITEKTQQQTAIRKLTKSLVSVINQTIYIHMNILGCITQ